MTKDRAYRVSRRLSPRNPLLAGRIAQALRAETKRCLRCIRARNPRDLAMAVSIESDIKEGAE